MCGWPHLLFFQEKGHSFRVESEMGERSVRFFVFMWLFFSLLSKWVGLTGFYFPRGPKDQKNEISSDIENFERE